MSKRCTIFSTTRRQHERLSIGPFGMYACKHVYGSERDYGGG